MTKDVLKVPGVKAGSIYSNQLHKRADVTNVSTTASLKTARISDGKLDFGPFENALQALIDGVFLLEKPNDISFEIADIFSRQFYRGRYSGGFGEYRELGPDYFDDPLLGYHQRSDQIEQFLLERRFWHKYPAEINCLGERLVNISKIVLEGVLELTEIPAKFHSTATGGCMELAGAYHLTFNHYRPSHSGIGLSSHKDDGFVTILRTNSFGLQVCKEDTWENIPYSNNHFVVNFGLSMELLTAHCSRPVSAILHRVIHQTNDRWSFGHFASSQCLMGHDAGIYQYRPDNGIVRICDSRELINANDFEIYSGMIAPE